MSVGHVQRAFESAGIPTVGIYIAAFEHVPRLMGVSRALVTDHPLGRPVGAPGDQDRHRDVVRAALELFESPSCPAIATFPHPYRTGH
ncbi:MAG: hypothetical protein H0U01_08350 [Acidimicrobiia bacterium]|nr:hypothetical protein [Acidimicrobiia bacterium]